MAERSYRAEADLWDTAGVRPGANVADVGCGPAAVTAFLAELVAPGGHVWALDATEEAVGAAGATVAALGLDNVTIARADASATGLEPDSFDVVMMRHVLAHNGPDEQRIVDHLATLVRPGGCVVLADGDCTAIRTWPPVPDYDDLIARYLAFHAQRGNDLKTGLRLDRVLAAAGLEVLDHRGRFEILPVTPGFRGPAWAARDAMVEVGLADAGDIDRWEATFARIDAGDLEFTVFVAPFAAVGRRPV